MKRILFACAVISALTLTLTVSADVFPIYDHKKQCVMAEQHMEPYSDEELYDFTTCILAERDAMGRLMHQWGSFNVDQKEHCLASSSETGRPDIVSYIEVEQCVTQQLTNSRG